MHQRKDGLWVEYITLATGTRKAFYGKTKSIVKKKIAAFSAEKEAGGRFFRAADDWDAYHATQTTYNANKVYAAPLRRAKEHFGDRYLQDITADEVQAWIRRLADQGYARRTVQLHLDMMRMLMDYAITRPGSGLSYNPCAAVRIPSGLPQKRRNPPTDEQLAQVTPNTDSEMGLFAYFLLYTGLRRGELLALRWEDIDRAAKTITVNKSVYYEGNQPLIKSPKTEAGVRVVDLLDILDRVLPGGQSGYVFGGEKPLTKIQFRKQWLNFCREVGLAEAEHTERKGANGRTYVSTTYKATVTPHQFRHAYASMLDDAGIDEMSAKTILGHSSIVVTKDIYTHLREQKRQRIGGALNAYIEKNTSENDSQE